MVKEGSRSGSTSGTDVELGIGSIGARIALVRGSLSQAEFAKTLDTHLNTVGQYERGQRVPVLDFIAKVCNVYGIEHAWLITGQGPMRSDGLLSDRAKALDNELLKAVIKEVKDAVSAGSYDLSTSQEAELITGVYQCFSSGPPGAPISKSAVEHLLRAIKPDKK